MRRGICALYQSRMVSSLLYPRCTPRLRHGSPFPPQLPLPVEEARPLCAAPVDAPEGHISVEDRGC